MCSTTGNIVLSAIGVILGISACTAFHFYENYGAVFWSCFSAMLAWMNLHLHWLRLKGKLEEWHSESTMSAIKLLSVLLTIVTSAFLTWYIFRIFYEHLSVYPIKDSLAITSVWTFMTVKWAFMLYLTSHKYQMFLRDATTTPLLLPS